MHLCRACTLSRLLLLLPMLLAASSAPMVPTAEEACPEPAGPDPRPMDMLPRSRKAVSLDFRRSSGTRQERRRKHQRQGGRR